MLRTVKYGETSVIATIFTEMFGIQSYLVNGVRVSAKKGTGKAALFQPVALLDLVVYHNELKQLQRLREYNWEHLYQHVFSDVRKNAVALFMIELLTRCLKQPEPNDVLFQFVEDALLHLDRGDDRVTANFPLFFALHLPYFFGFRISSRTGPGQEFLDLVEGSFSDTRPNHLQYLEGELVATAADILRVMHPDELGDIALHQAARRSLLGACELYYSLHVPDFGKLKTIPVLQTVLG